MQERSIDVTLLALRKATIREARDGLEHVEALLVMRGVTMPRVRRTKCQDVARMKQARQVARCGRALRRVVQDFGPDGCLWRLDR